MLQTRLGATFEPKLFQSPTILEGLPRRARQRLRRDGATLEFTVIFVWAFTPFVFAFLIS